jgi:hypothetical protein
MKNTKVVFLLSGLVLGLNAFGSEQNINARMVGKGADLFLQNVEKAIESQNLTWLTMAYSMAEILTNPKLEFVGFKNDRKNFIGYEKNLNLEKESYYCFESQYQQGMVQGLKMALASIIKKQNKEYFLKIKKIDSKTPPVEFFSKFEE